MKQAYILSTLIMLAIFSSSACMPTPAVASSPAVTPSTPAPSATTAPSLTPEPSATPTNTPTSEPTATATQVLVKVGPGPIHCPILLYHRIVPGQGDNPYNLAPDVFEEEMKYLYEHGYTTISIEQLRKAIVFGAELPEKPIVITFDDGDVSVYKNAYPIMQKYGFTGVVYLVTTYLETPGYMKNRMVKDLIKSGWEIGSHTSRHQDVTTTLYIESEVHGSKVDLEKLFDVKVRTFAYPFGAFSPGSMNKVAESYSNAVGLGASTIQRESNLYYLWRRPIDNGTTLDQFIEFLK